MLTHDKITEIFCIIDEYCKGISENLDHHWINTPSKTKTSQMHDSEIMTIILLFHHSERRNFKSYYLNDVKNNWKNLFPKSVSYSQFNTLMRKVLTQFMIFLHICGFGQCTGISYVDSTILPVCHNKRVKRNKVFKGIAESGKSTMGWFFGFKLHLIINEFGEILNYQLTKGNTDDRTPLESENLLKNIFGSLFGDKGYISQKLTNILSNKKIKLITGLKKNMKNKLMFLKDKILLAKRSIIETVNGKLKTECHIHHTRHRSVVNFLVNLVSGIAAYQLLSKKPKIILNRKSQVILIKN